MLTNSRPNNQQPNQKHKMQQHSRPSRCYILKPLLLAATIILVHSIAPASASEHEVRIYKNASTSLGQLVTSSTLVWATYDPKDPKQLQFAVEGGKYITEDEHYPIYVCRVTIEGITTSGHTEKILQAHVCVAAHYKHGKYEQFDVLVNKGRLGMVTWKLWRKLNAGIPIGAIRIGVEDFIGRHKVPTTGESVAEHRGADYNLGRYSTVGLGKIKVIENGRDKDYDEGEVLVESEPFGYELRDIKLDSLRLEMHENVTDLASSVLANSEGIYSLVKSVMTYNFDHVQFWGSHEGVARGLPTKVYEANVAAPTEIEWGMQRVDKRDAAKSVETKLWPGTALNVTLKGNYVTLKAPYSAKLYVFSYGINDSVSRKITAKVHKSYLKDVKLEFSPVYWIENGTFVPTTTTASTTSTSTSTTTNPTTTSHEPVPMHEPPVVGLKNIGETYSGPDSLEKSLHDEPISNEIPSDVPQNLAAEQKPALAGIAGAGGGQQLQQEMNTLFIALSAVALWGVVALRGI